jgi:hypothetical protein
MAEKVMLLFTLLENGKAIVNSRADGRVLL